MDNLLRLAIITAVLFYCYIFARKTPKSGFFLNLIISTITAIIATLIVAIFIAVAFSGAHNLIFTMIMAGAVVGLFEEAVRSKLSTRFIRSKNSKVFWKKVSAPKDASVYIYGLGFLYAAFESYHLIIGLFSGKVSLLTAFIFGQETSLNPDITAPTQFLEIAFLLAALILRYYIHITLLKFSITALLERKRAAFYMALAVHFCANLSIGFLNINFFGMYIIPDKSGFTITLVSLATIVIVTLLMKVFALKPATLQTALKAR